ncbi:hypothetical protein [Conexibacter sp. CPCC 206217]|uniref:hypothetical protein n=1 Tax=Conexibacter sp. CPCC 206217 TaxID=3064574 RepID=UPI0027170C6A|nr:hypothetical protein [Conexibacter sp. CPCC 206217]MDO8212181.1 hypothetical protein [Conexibacter sp. CPCC 206217]
MMILLQLLARLVAFLLLLALALAGLAVAVFSIQDTHTGLSIEGLAHDARLPQLRDTVGDFLASVERGGPVAVVAALCGLGAIVLGLLLVLGVVGSRRERLIVLDDGAQAGRTAAKRRPLAQVATALSEQVRGVTSVRARAHAGRRRSTVGVRIDRAATADAQQIGADVRQALSSLTDVGVRARVETRRGGPRSRVA